MQIEEGAGSQNGQIPLVYRRCRHSAKRRQPPRQIKVANFFSDFVGLSERAHHRQNRSLIANSPQKSACENVSSCVCGNSKTGGSATSAPRPRSDLLDDDESPWCRLKFPVGISHGRKVIGRDSRNESSWSTSPVPCGPRQPRVVVVGSEYPRCREGSDAIATSSH
jgi:hypothetical protein